MARVTSELAEIAANNLHIAEAEIIATGDAETILWALDQIRQADVWLKLVMEEPVTASGAADAPPKDLLQKIVDRA